MLMFVVYDSHNNCTFCELQQIVVTQGFGEPPTRSRPVCKKLGLNSKIICVIAYRGVRKKIHSDNNNNNNNLDF